MSLLHCATTFASFKAPDCLLFAKYMHQRGKHDVTRNTVSLLFSLCWRTSYSQNECFYNILCQVCVYFKQHVQTSKGYQCLIACSKTSDTMGQTQLLVRHACSRLRWHLIRMQLCLHRQPRGFIPSYCLQSTKHALQKHTLMCTMCVAFNFLSQGYKRQQGTVIKVPLASPPHGVWKQWTPKNWGWKSSSEGCVAAMTESSLNFQQCLEHMAH